MDLDAPHRNAAAFSPAEDNVFARIATRYDFLCDMFSLYAHRLWKDRMAKRISSDSWHQLLDVASGTGDIPLRVLRYLRTVPGASARKRILVSDICPEMLSVAKSKRGADHRLEYLILDAHDLRDIESNSIDVYSISFGMKILDRERVLAEARRVLKPGARFFCLEAARVPVELLHSAYLKYMDWCVPLIARLATGGDAGAYNYLLRGVHEFPAQSEFSRQLERQGFRNVVFENLTLGIVALHEGVKR